MQFSASPADTVAGNTDILTEILRRLPPKSLLRFKSVSREWRSLISSPFFASLHHHRPLLSGVLLHRSSKSTLEFALLHGGPHHRPNPSPLGFAGDSPVAILQASNGLLLCSARRGPHRRTFHVYNPTTGASAEVRSPSLGSSTPWMNLAFDPSESQHYQLIRIDTTPSIQIRRYSSATGNWSPCRSPNSTPPFNSVLAGGVYWRGSLHWLGPTSEPALSSSLSFHLQTETFRPMPPVLRPAGDRRRRRQAILSSSGDSLLLVEVYEEGEIRLLRVQEDYSTWEVLFDRISIISIISEAYPRVAVGPTSKGYYKFQVCETMAEGEEAAVVVRVPGKVLGCGVGTRRVWEMREVFPSSQSASDFEWIDVFPFVETLACV